MKSAPTVPAEPKVNVPLVDSENERARILVTLDEKFVTDVAEMNPSAAAYFRQRPYLTAEVCKKWRVGYLPRNTGGDSSGGTMRGKIVYGYRDKYGQVLTWFGRDPEHEKKHRKWVSGGREGREPAKFHFVKGFHRGLQFFGEHQWAEQQNHEKLAGLGLIIVEGPNDVIALDALDMPAVALCSNTITTEQAQRAAKLAGAIGGVVTLMLDCDEQGENGARQAVAEIAKYGPVRLAWATDMHDGAYRGRQPESLTLEEWRLIHDTLRRENTE